MAAPAGVVKFRKKKRKISEYLPEDEYKLASARSVRSTCMSVVHNTKLSTGTRTGAPVIDSMKDFIGILPQKWKNRGHMHKQQPRFSLLPSDFSLRIAKCQRDSYHPLGMAEENILEPGKKQRFNKESFRNGLFHLEHTDALQ